MGIWLKKGQAFLVLATIMSVILVLLRATANLPDVLQRERELRGRFEREFFRNIAKELVKVVEISSYQPSKITTNVFDFGNFTRKKMDERLQSFEFLFVGSITPKSEGQATMNVTLLNLLKKNINATLQLNGSTPVNYSELLDSSSWTVSYSIIQGESYVLTVGYNGTYSENIMIETKVNKSIYVGFFDVTLSGSEASYKDKFQKSYILP